jgi:hypothetical protein
MLVSISRIVKDSSMFDVWWGVRWFELVLWWLVVFWDRCLCFSLCLLYYTLPFQYPFKLYLSYLLFIQSLIPSLQFIQYVSMVSYSYLYSFQDLGCEVCVLKSIGLCFVLVKGYWGVYLGLVYWFVFSFWVYVSCCVWIWWKESGEWLEIG